MNSKPHTPPSSRPSDRPLCRCGSGRPRRDLKDAHGIFCAFVCEDCEAATRDSFNPAIFDARRYPADEPLTDD